MSRKALLAVLVTLFVASLMLGCASPTPAPTTTAQPAAETQTAALKCTGAVAEEKAWSVAELKAMDQVEAPYVGKDGTTTNYSGVPVATLVDLAKPNAGAATLTLVADDGYTVDVPLADVVACANCVVGIEDGGGLRSVMPDLAKNTSVKGLVEIQVK